MLVTVFVTVVVPGVKVVVSVFVSVSSLVTPLGVTERMVVAVDGEPRRCEQGPVKFPS